MKNKYGTILLAIMVYVPVCAQPLPACEMTFAFKQKDSDAKGGLTTVWSDSTGSSLLFVERLNVNTDGTRRSYSVEDFWGEKTALNNLCNAMSDACAGLKKDGKRARRLLTQKAAAEGWTDDLLAQTKISSSIIPFKSGKPCPPLGEFLVSATALHKPDIKDVCDIGNYVDALVTPAIVIPKNQKVRDPANPAKLVEIPSEFAKRNAKVGDLVVAALPGVLEPVFAVVGDTGPIDSLGEGSVALNGKLLKRVVAPANYREIRGFTGKAWTVPPTVQLIFTATRNVENPYMELSRIDSAASARFQAWGGTARLESCMNAMGYGAFKNHDVKNN